jgi:hypothetical protein
MVLLKPSEHPDVGQSERTAAFERNPDSHPLGSMWFALAGSDEWRKDYSE